MTGLPSLAGFVEWVRIARDLHAQRVNRRVRAAEERLQVVAAEREVHRLLGKLDDADALAVGVEHPDAAGARAVHAALAVDLEAVRHAGPGAFVHVREDAAA